MNNNAQPFLALLRSRKVILWFAGLLAVLVVHFLPALQSFQNELVGGIFLGLLSLTTQITAEDVAKARAAKVDNKSIPDLLHEGIATGFDELQNLTPAEQAQLVSLVNKMKD